MMTTGEAIVFVGVIFLVFAVLAAFTDWLERRRDRELLRRFRENQRLRRSS